MLCGSQDLNRYSNLTKNSIKKALYSQLNNHFYDSNRFGRECKYFKGNSSLEITGSKMVINSTDNVVSLYDMNTLELNQP